jgi:hypothetical protein
MAPATIAHAPSEIPSWRGVIGPLYWAKFLSIRVRTSTHGRKGRFSDNRALAHAPQSEGAVKQAEDAAFVDLIACERDCRNCSYAAALDCDGNCGVCPHNGYCPCVNPVVARSKTALRLIELRPLLLQDLQGRN